MNENIRRRVIINPHNAIAVHSSLTLVRQPLETPEVWIKRNTKLLEDMGVEAWLKLLLDVLEDGGFANPDNDVANHLLVER
jgi:hypothetical protein